jgi:hypothetical protein
MNFPATNQDVSTTSKYLHNQHLIQEHSVSKLTCVLLHCTTCKKLFFLYSSDLVVEHLNSLVLFNLHMFYLLPFPLPSQKILQYFDYAYTCIFFKVIEELHFI